MPVLRKNEVRELSKEELKIKSIEIKGEIMSERAKISSGGVPDNPGKIKELRRAIAKIKTIAGEKGYKLYE